VSTGRRLRYWLPGTPSLTTVRVKTNADSYGVLFRSFRREHREEHSFERCLNQRFVALRFLDVRSREIGICQQIPVYRVPPSPDTRIIWVSQPIRENRLWRNHISTTSVVFARHVFPRGFSSRKNVRKRERIRRANANNLNVVHNTLFTICDHRNAKQVYRV